MKQLSPREAGSKMTLVHPCPRRKSEMRVRLLVSCVLSVMLLSLAVGCSKKEPPQPAAPAAPAAAPAAPAADGRAVFEAKCGVCHPLDRTTVRQETRDTWVSIVKDMQGRKSGWISDAEAAKIIEFLTAEYGKK
jgi:mono/diheme cytochrome c family protein